MKGLTKVYWRLFITYGSIFGFLMSLWDYFDEGEISFYKTTFMVVFFGGFMSWTSVKSMKKSKKKFGGGELTEEDFKASQIEIISKNKSISEIYDLLKSDDSTKKWKLKFEESKITGKTKVSWTSWGERITISDLNEKIKIESKPMLRTIMFDNGANKENVILLKVLIENENPAHNKVHISERG
jgi:hypothetical protein